jgi:ParB family transcriptional regulator, chromosome partitioning protein
MPLNLTLIKVADIHADPGNPREQFPQEELDKLAESIDQVGILVPVVVYQTEIGGYRLLDGERRWRCSKQLGLVEIPAVVVDELDEGDRLIQMFNIHLVREQWKEVPTAHALQRLMEATGISDDKALHQRTGLSMQQIERYKFALGLGGEVRKAIESGEVGLNFFHEVWKSFVLPLKASRPGLSQKYGDQNILERFLKKRRSGAISDVVSVRNAKYIVRKAAEDAEGAANLLDQTIVRLIEDENLSVTEAYEDTVMVTVEADKLQARAEGMVNAFKRLLGKAESDDEKTTIKKVAENLIVELKGLL